MIRMNATGSPSAPRRARPFRVLRPVVLLLFLAGPGALLAADPPEDEASPSGTVDDAGGDAAKDGTKSTPETDDRKTKEEKGGIKFRYKNGIHVESADGNYAARFQFRVQMRLTDVTSPDLVGEEDGVEEETGFLIRRARFKMNGHVYRPWIRYKMEYGIEGSVLLTWRFDVAPWEQFGVRVGQYKVTYNRERVDSSGKLTFVDRSIVNSPFTVDRQEGFEFFGHLFKGTRGDSSYWAGVYTGTGRGGPLDSDRRPMYMARWQWNFLKVVLPFSESDLLRRKKAAASFAVAFSSNRSRFTRFSSAGGGELPGFAPGLPGQYKLQQWVAEFAQHYRGLSIQAEYHKKRIDDEFNRQTSELRGFYAQAGYFFHEAFPAFPRPLEIALRIAAVDSTQGIELPADREATLAVNWFFDGHNNKLTADVSRLKSQGSAGTDDQGWRVRAQWDITF
ncbi:MAG: porin [Acidobacteriota bacterium]